MKPMYNVDDVKKALDVGDTKAYEVIKTLNEELSERGYLTVRGRVSAQYFNERFFGQKGAI